MIKDTWLFGVLKNEDTSLTDDDRPYFQYEIVDGIASNRLSISKISGDDTGISDNLTPSDFQIPRESEPGKYLVIRVMARIKDKTHPKYGYLAQIDYTVNVLEQAPVVIS